MGAFKIKAMQNSDTSELVVFHKVFCRFGHLLKAKSITYVE